MGFKIRPQFISFALLLAMFAVFRADAASLPVHISGQSGLRWEAQGDLLMIEGDVIVRYDNFTLTCDRLVVNTSKEVMEAFGQVTYVEESEEIEASYFQYDFASGTGEFSRVSLVFNGDEFSGDGYMKGNALKLVDGDAFLTTASFTGCNLDQPHYHLEAAEIEYYPDDKLIARKVSYFEGHLKLFTLPYLYVSLKENSWDTPKIGYNPSDGWYIKTTYNYYRNPDWLGALFIDYYQLKGWGTGFRHEYNLHGPLPASGWLYFYAKENGHNAEPLSLRTALSYQPKLPDSWKAQFQGEVKRDYILGEIRHEWGSNANLSWQQGYQRVAGNYSLLNKNPDELYRGSIFEQTRFSLNYDNRPRPDLRYAFSSSLLSQARVGLPREEPSVFGQGWVSQTFNDYNLLFKAEHKHNADTSYNLLPEVRLTTRNMRLWHRLPLRASLTARRVQEDPANRSAMSATGQLSLSGLNYRVTPQVNLASTADLLGTYYDTNMGQAELRIRNTFNQRLTRNIRTVLTHRWTGRAGISPLQYDLAQPTHDLQARAEYTNIQWRAALTGGYDILSSTPQDITAEVRYRHSQLLNSTVQFAYGFPENQPLYAKMSTAYSRDKENSLQGSLYYDFTEDLWRQVSVQAKHRLNSSWAVEAQVDWDGLYGGRLRQGRVGVTRDLHCRELRVTVDAVREEIWFELRFDLFPGEPLRLGAADERFLVDLEFLEGEI